ncbi:MAG: hypothetical protein C4288_11290 [Leptolyngbya sp. ERB_1_1]
MARSSTWVVSGGSFTRVVADWLGVLLIPWRLVVEDVFARGFLVEVALVVDSAMLTVRSAFDSLAIAGSSIDWAWVIGVVWLSGFTFVIVAPGASESLVR